MFRQRPAITVLGVLNIRLMFADPFLRVRCFPDVEFPATSTPHDVDDVFGVAVEESSILPLEFAFLAESKHFASSDKSCPVVLTIPATVIQT